MHISIYRAPSAIVLLYPDKVRCKENKNEKCCI
uniref:Uncharacterized protein n=1 Tax=Arundo donax TaxID=35708 RepID=A0A0A9F5K9_ARUDO